MIVKHRFTCKCDIFMPNYWHLDISDEEDDTPLLPPCHLTPRPSRSHAADLVAATLYGK